MSNRVEVVMIPDCDFCNLLGKGVKASVDGATKMGPWANMCPEHFRQYGVGLGTGLGQELVVRSQDNDPEEFPTTRQQLAQEIADELGLDVSEVDLSLEVWADDGGAVV